MVLGTPKKRLAECSGYRQEVDKMKFRILMMISLFLAIFAANTCAVKWNDQGSQTVDQMFAGDNRSLDTGSDTGVVHTGSFNTESSDAGSASSMTSGEYPNSQASTDTRTPEYSGSVTISGRWSMELNYGAPPKASLNLFQNESVIYGTGDIVLDSKTSLEVAASGTLIGDKLNLDMVSLGNVSLYRASMTVIGNSASGTYTAYRPNVSPISHTIAGIRFVANSKM
jgi:hypothetical protein